MRSWPVDRRRQDVQRSKLSAGNVDAGRTTRELTPAGREMPICGDPDDRCRTDGTVYGWPCSSARELDPGVTSTDFGAHWSGAVRGVRGESDDRRAGQSRRCPAARSAWPWLPHGRPDTGEVSTHSQEDGAVEGRWLTTSRDKGATWAPQRRSTRMSSRRRPGPLSAAGGTIACPYIVDPTSPNYGHE